MKIQEMIDVLKAYQEGKKIEFTKNNSENKWEDVYIPSWNFHLYDYRVKPELKSRRFKLIKEFPLSPSLGTIVEFKTEGDFNDGIYDFGAICLILTDCTNYPEFWEEIIEIGYTKIDDLVGKRCTYKSGGFTYVISAQGTEFLRLTHEDSKTHITISYNSFNYNYKIC